MIKPENKKAVVYSLGITAAATALLSGYMIIMHPNKHGLNAALFGIVAITGIAALVINSKSEIASTEAPKP